MREKKEKVYNDKDDIKKNVELQSLRKQVSSFMLMEQGYNSELFASISLTNELLVTLQDILKNRDSAVMMKQMYQNKVNYLEHQVRQNQVKWSVMIKDYQSRISPVDAMQTNLNQKKQGKEEKKEEKKTYDIYFDDDIPEITDLQNDKLDNNEDNDEKQDEKKENDKPKYSDNVPIIYGFVAGEELFERQANAQGFEEEVVIMTQ